MILQKINDLELKFKENFTKEKRETLYSIYQGFENKSCKLSNKEINIKQWIEKFNKGDFDKPDFDTQCNAGWYDWDCNITYKDLKNKTNYIGNIIKKLKHSSKLNLDSQYVWFRNTHNLEDCLYDEFRIGDINNGYTIYCIEVNPPIDWYGEYKLCVFNEDSRDEPILKTNNEDDLIEWFNN